MYSGGGEVSLGGCGLFASIGNAQDGWVTVSQFFFLRGCFHMRWGVSLRGWGRVSPQGMRPRSGEEVCFLCRDW